MATIAIFYGLRVISWLTSGNNTIVTGHAATDNGAMINPADTHKRNRVVAVLTCYRTEYV